MTVISAAITPSFIYKLPFLRCPKALPSAPTHCQFAQHSPLWWATMMRIRTDPHPIAPARVRIYIIGANSLYFLYPLRLDILYYRVMRFCASFRVEYMYVWDCGGGIYIFREYYLYITIARVKHIIIGRLAGKGKKLQSAPKSKNEAARSTIYICSLENANADNAFLGPTQIKQILYCATSTRDRCNN